MEFRHAFRTYATRGSEAVRQFTIRRRALIVVAAFCGYLAGTVALAWTRMPQSDEGHFADAGYELAHTGRLAMPMWTEWISSLDRHVYIQMPLYYLQLAPWVAVAGSSLRAVRLDSVLWGVVLVVAWYWILRVLTGPSTVALLGLVLLAFNYDVMNLTSTRYDPMCAALSAAGLACYLAWRERRLTIAVVSANACIAAAMLTHPFGVIGLIGFCVFFAVYDASRLTWRLLIVAALPYLVAVAGWGAYVLQDPAAFHAQLTANAEGRVSSLSHPLFLLRREIQERYLVRFAGLGPGVPIFMRVKVVILASYFVSLVGCLAMPTLRRRKEVRALTLWALLGFGVLAVADSHRWYVYLVHVVPIYTAILALCLGALVVRGRWLRRMVITATAAWALFATATVLVRVRLDDYDRVYRPTLDYLERNVRSNDLVMAGGEFGPGLGFSTHVLDDPKLGYGSGLTPDWIVQDKLHEELMTEWARTEPGVYRHVQQTMASYALVLEARQPYNFYRVYRRNRS